MPCPRGRAFSNSLSSQHRLDGENAVQPIAWPGVVVELGTVESTNTRALELVDSGLGDDFAVVAEEQLAGRGRLGRSWISPPGGGLYCSVAARPAVEPRRLPQATLVMAVAAAEAAAALGARLSIKWPNDLYFCGRKVGGILAEVAPSPCGGPDAVVIGVGMNLRRSREESGSELADSIDSLDRIAGGDVDRDHLLGELLARFHAWRLRWEREGFTPVRSRWLDHDCTVGKWVTVGDGKAGKALVEGIDAAGRLVARDASGKRRRVVADDVVLAGWEGGGRAS